MAPERLRQFGLAALLVVLWAVLYQMWPRWSAPAEPRPSASNSRRASARATGDRSAMRAPDVHLEALKEPRPTPGETKRDLFRFKPKAQPPPPRPAAPVGVNPRAAPPGPPPPPLVPPIPLRLIGFAGEQGQPRIAALVDERGVVHTAVEGGTIDGRFRILRIGVESVEVAYVDGRGRQSLPLSNR